MRIALFSPFAPSDPGFEYTVRGVCSGLASAGHTVHVLYAGTQNRICVEDSFTLHEVCARATRVYSAHPMVNRMLRDGQALYEKAMSLHAETPFDVLDVPLDRALGYITLLHTRIPTVLSAWDAPSMDGLTPPERHWARILQERCVEYAGVIEARSARAELLCAPCGDVCCAYGNESLNPFRKLREHLDAPPHKTERICQIMTALSARDAVSNIARDAASLLATLGAEPKIAARYYPPELQKEVLPVLNFLRAPDCSAIFHHWNYNPDVWLLNKVRGKKAMFYHNITPPEFFPPDSPLRACCTLGYRQLAEIVNRFDLLIGVSAYNLQTLRPYLSESRPAIVVPPLLDAAALQKAPVAAARLHTLRADPSATHFLFVGRVARNKRHERVMELFDHYYRIMDSRAHLWLVGNDSQDAGYRRELEQLRLMMASGRNIHFTGSVTDDELTAFYRGAHAFICASEHEGFCVPIAQSMALNLPVLALAAAAVPETMGPATCCAPVWDIPGLAETLRRLRHDAAFRQNILTVQQANARRFSAAAVSDRLKAVVHFLRDDELSPLMFSLEPLNHA